MPGFRTHALNIGTPIDVISINGGGATEVRKKLAQRELEGHEK